MGTSQRSVIVVGSGIVGASIAWHLTARGAAVTIIDAATPSGVATPNSFAWINSNFNFPQAYFRLRHHSMQDWRRLACDVPELPVTFNGSVYLPAANIDLEEFARRNAEWGYRAELIDAKQVRQLEPNLALEADVAVRAHDEGSAEPVETARILAGDAVARGAVLREGTCVELLHVTDNGVSGVVAGDDLIEADDVVIAAGVATAELAKTAGFAIPLDLPPPPGLLAHTKPLPRLLNGLVLADGLHVRQKVNGELVAGSDYQGSDLADDPEAGGAELMRRLRDAVRSDQEIVLDRTTTGYRPMPVDGVPVAGRLPGVDGLYVAVTHSGVTLCPALGDFAAREILEGSRDPLLAPFGAERFAGAEAVGAA